MSKSYLPYDPDQHLLLPAVLQEWLPEDHLAYFISDLARRPSIRLDCICMTVVIESAAW